MERCYFRRGAGGIETGSGRNLSGFRHRFEQKWEGRTKNKWRSLLEQALAIDPDAAPEQRMLNLVMQRKARWLLLRIDDLFLVSE